MRVVVLFVIYRDGICVADADQKGEDKSKKKGGGKLEKHDVETYLLELTCVGLFESFAEVVKVGLIHAW